MALRNWELGVLVTLGVIIFGAGGWATKLQFDLGEAQDEIRTLKASIPGQLDTKIESRVAEAVTKATAATRAAAAANNTAAETQSKVDEFTQNIQAQITRLAQTETSPRAVAQTLMDMPSFQTDISKRLVAHHSDLLRGKDGTSPSVEAVAAALFETYGPRLKGTDGQPGPSAEEIIVELQENHRDELRSLIEPVDTSELEQELAGVEEALLDFRKQVTTDGSCTRIHTIKICSGVQQARWQHDIDTGDEVLIADIDTSAANFRDTPNYFTSMSGNAWHWLTTGATSIYDARPGGFRVRIHVNAPLGNEVAIPWNSWPDGSEKASYASDRWSWRIHWVAIGKV